MLKEEWRKEAWLMKDYERNVLKERCRKKDNEKENDKKDNERRMMEKF